jgi:hypothetical protein
MGLKSAEAQELWRIYLDRVQAPNNIYGLMTVIRSIRKQQ